MNFFENKESFKESGEKSGLVPPPVETSNKYEEIWHIIHRNDDVDLKPPEEVGEVDDKVEDKDDNKVDGKVEDKEPVTAQSDKFHIKKIGNENFEKGSLDIERFKEQIQGKKDEIVDYQSDLTVNSVKTVINVGNVFSKYTGYPDLTKGNGVEQNNLIVSVENDEIIAWALWHMWTDEDTEQFKVENFTIRERVDLITNLFKNLQHFACVEYFWVKDGNEGIGKQMFDRILEETNKDVVNFSEELVKRLFW